MVCVDHLKIAGLVAHLSQRQQYGNQQNWLIFGERQQQFDHLYKQQIELWQEQGFLPDVDYAFSRDQAEKVYVHHLLRHNSAELKQWIERGAVIYVCGSIQGMASDVDQALQDILGTAQVDQLREQGRYRRDVY